ncbi:MAG TPA: hypothetical protein VJP80_07610 [Candidatus Saccharimonadales bacterium]|nr:hypothetical protein [Candidatus Saccharimonadales bacterium]
MATTLPDDDQAERSHAPEHLAEREQGQTNPANIQGHYNSEFNRLGRGGQNQGDKESRVAQVADKAEKIKNAADKASAALGAEGKAASKVADTVTKALQFGGSHKKSVVSSIISIIITAGLLIGGFSFVHSELISVEKAVNKIADRIRRDEIQHKEESLVNKLSREFRSKAQAKAEAAAHPDEPLTQQVDGFDMTKLARAMEVDGNTIHFDAQGNVTKITDPGGKDITNKVTVDDMPDGMKQLVNAEARVNYVPTIADHADASFRGLGDPANPKKQSFNEDQLKKAVVEQIKNGISGSSTIDTTSAINEQDPGGNPNSPQQQNFQAAKQQTGALGEALDAANKAFAQTNSAIAAENAGRTAFMSGALGRSLTVLGAITTACSLEQVTQQAADARVPQIMTLLMRHASFFLAMSSQVQNGQQSAGTLSSYMKLLNGNSAAPPNTDGTPSEASMPFTRSAAWQAVTNPVGVAVVRAQGGKLLYDLSDASLPLANGATKIIDKIQQAMNLTGSAFSCKALTSPTGVFIQLGAGVGQIIADIGTLGAAQAATIAANVAFQFFLSKEVVPEIIRYFTVTQLLGTENSVQQLNADALGLHLNSGEAGRALGNVPLTKTQVAMLTNQAINTEIAQNARLPLKERLFDTSNPDSLAATIMLHMPTGVTSALSNLPRALTGLPSAIFHSVASIFTPRSVFAATTAATGDPYSWGTSTYGNVSADRYDITGNEHYLYSNITVNGQTFKRIDALGNPYNYTDSGSGDTNTDDLMHCFVDSYAMMADNSSGNPNQHFCGTLGTFTGKDPVVPNDDTAAHIYCAFAGNDTNACANSIRGQMSDEVGHYQQYLLDKGGINGLKAWVDTYATK